jgi:hypothetical protein
VCFDGFGCFRLNHGPLLAIFGAPHTGFRLSDSRHSAWAEELLLWTCGLVGYVSKNNQGA